MAEETSTTPAATPRKPQMRTEAAASVNNFTPIRMEVSTNKKKQIRGRTTMPVESLYVDRSGTFATDGREDLPIDYSLVKSLLRFWTTDRSGAVWPKIADIKVTIGGTDEEPQIIVLNGRQRYKAIVFLNELLKTIYSMLQNNGGDEIRLKNALIALGEAARNVTTQTPPEEAEKLAQWAWMDAEDVEFICGGKVNNEKVQGLLFKNKEKEGPMPYWAHVQYTDINPNEPEALELSLAERITVPTPLSLRAKQAQRLLDAGRSPETVAAVVGRDVKTLHNWRLILMAEPAVQAALDLEEGGLSFVNFKKMFFLSTTKHGTVIRPREEQLKILEDLVANNAGKGKAGTDFRNKLQEQLEGTPTTPTPAPQGTPAPTPAPASPGTDIVPSSGAPAPQAPAPAPANGNMPMPPPPAAPPKKKATGFGTVILDSLPRTVIYIREKIKLIPEARVEQGADVYIPTLKMQAAAEGAAATLAYLGGDATALDSMPDLKPIITEALAMARLEAEAAAKAPPTEEKLDPKADQARILFAIFSEWDDNSDSASEWPQEPEDGETNLCGWPDDLAERLSAREGMSLIQKAYAARMQENPTPIEKKDFAQEWIMTELLGQSI